MNKLQKTGLTGLLAVLAWGASAQTYEVIERRNFWNAGSNVTGIRMDSVTVSNAELYGKNEHGGFRDSYQAGEMWRAGASARTITHLERYSMIGAFSFDHASGREMSGPMFIRPGFYPVDVLEFTPGRKDLQTYAAMGGIAVDIAPHWRLGGKIDFAAANYAKRKDLRHSNFRLDLEVAPGVMYHRGDLALGLAYLFGKNSETVKAEQIGDPEEPYMAFLDKGLMYGVLQSWNGSGTHLQELSAGFPVKELIHGVALQAQWGSLYADVEYRYAAGEAGEGRVIWFEFPSHRISSHLGYRFGEGVRTHFLRINVDWSRLVNYENTLIERNEESGDGVTITHVIKSKTNRIFERNALSLNPEYELHCPLGEFRLGAAVSWLDRLTTLMYPYATTQTMRRYQAYASGVFHVGKFDLKAGAAFATGDFTEQNRRSDTGAVEPGDPPVRLTDYYNLQNEYLTASRLAFDLGLRYNFCRSLYAELGAGYAHGFNLHYIAGANRWCETLKLGYTF